MEHLQKAKGLGGIILGALMVPYFAKRAIYSVDTGHKAFKFNKYSGVKMATYKEGLHFMIPWLEHPIIYNVKSTPKEFKC